MTTRQTPDAVREAVAKAMYDATHAGLSNCYAWEDHWEDYQEHHRSRYYKEAQAAIDCLAALDSRAGDAGEVKAYRCRGCGWRGSEPIANGHPQNGCDLELMVHDPIATPAPAPNSAGDAGEGLAVAADSLLSAYRRKYGRERGGIRENALFRAEFGALASALNDHRLATPAPAVDAHEDNPACPGEWDHRYRPLAHGEIIAETDECRRDDGTWITGVCVGQPAPDPAYTSHRVYRRLKSPAVDALVGIERAKGIAEGMAIAFAKMAVSTKYDAEDRERWEASRDDAEEIFALLSAPAVDAVPAGEVERVAIREFLIACADAADFQGTKYAPTDNRKLLECRAEAKAYRNAARMIFEQDHAFYRSAALSHGEGR